MKKRKLGPIRRRVNSVRNSECASGIPLEDLDWNNWWTDGQNFQTYLHVQHINHDVPGDNWEGTTHRVYCRHGKQNRIGLFKGVLYWLIDKL